jgi:hypothetical protein
MGRPLLLREAAGRCIGIPQEEAAQGTTPDRFAFLSVRPIAQAASSSLL